MIAFNVAYALASVLAVVWFARRVWIDRQAMERADAFAKAEQFRRALRAAQKFGLVLTASTQGFVKAMKDAQEAMERFARAWARSVGP